MPTVGLLAFLRHMLLELGRLGANEPRLQSAQWAWFQMGRTPVRPMLRDADFSWSRFRQTAHRCSGTIRVALRCAERPAQPRHCALLTASALDPRKQSGWPPSRRFLRPRPASGRPQPNAGTCLCLTRAWLGPWSIVIPLRATRILPAHAAPR